MSREPQINVEVFQNRRKQLAPLIKGGALILASHPTQIRNNDVHHPYRADSNLVYLSGFEEPNSVLIFRPGQEPESVLFVQPKDPLSETWDGFRYGKEQAKALFRVDEAYDISEFESIAPRLLSKVNKIYYKLFWDPKMDEKIKSVVHNVQRGKGRSGQGNLPIEDSSSLLGEMRIRKCSFEADTLRKAAQLSCEAHVALMKAIQPGMNERELHGLFIYEVMKRGASREGYGSIMAGGSNATTLHYVFNDQVLNKEDLILVDAGGEIDHYTADITRTYPVSGKFSKTQGRIYQGILDTQKQLIEAVRPGVTMDSIQELAIENLTEIMISEKLLKGSLKELIEQKKYRKYYPHNVGHWLGMDVHDAGLAQIADSSRILEPGFCLTIEPGLYIPKDDKDAPEELRGLGIRIEDNILVTEEGHENLTVAAPKEIHDLENTISS